MFINGLFIVQVDGLV